MPTTSRNRVGSPSPHAGPGWRPSVATRRDLPAPRVCGYGYPRVMRMPADWWDSPTAVGYPLNQGPRSVRAARHLTRNTFSEWDLVTLAESGEIIVGELVANAVTHAATPDGGREAAPETLGLRLMRRGG